MIIYFCNSPFSFFHITWNSYILLPIGIIPYTEPVYKIHEKFWMIPPPNAQINSPAEL